MCLEGGAGDGAQLRERLLSLHEDLVPALAWNKSEVVVHGHNSSPTEVAAGGAGTQAHPLLRGELDAGLGYMRSCLRKGKQVQR